MDLTPLWTALITGGVAVIGGLVAYIVARLKKETTKQEVEELKVRQDALEDELTQVKKLATIHKLYVECPNCHTEIDLSKVDIYQKDEEVKADD